MPVFSPISKSTCACNSLAAKRASFLSSFLRFARPASASALLSATCISRIAWLDAASNTPRS
ncbi:hypothetical protein BDV93DRAFT_525197, partial [Ceratobasidium sp. AG-I]